MSNQQQNGVIVTMSKARQALALAKTAQDAKKIADLAKAHLVWAKAQELGDDILDETRYVMIDATAVMGEFLLAAEKNKGAKGSKVTGNKREPVKDTTPTLGEIGLTKRESADAQLLARTKKRRPKVYEQVWRGEIKLSQLRLQVKRQKKIEELEAMAQEVERNPSPAGVWRVVTGDVEEELHKLRDTEVRPRLIFADPPYNIGVDYGGGEKADRHPESDYLFWCSKWLLKCHDVLAPDGSLWLLINHENAAALELIARGTFLLQMKTDSMLEQCMEASGGTALSVLTGLERFHVRNWITWYETFGVNCTDKFNRCSRRLLHLVKDPNNFVFHPEAVTRPSDRQTKYDDKRAAEGGKLWDDVWEISRLTGTCDERIPGFPTQLPLELLRPIVRCCTDPGDLVLDPFSGSATTGVAAIEAGRRYLGVERSSRFATLSRARLKGVTANGVP